MNKIQINNKEFYVLDMQYNCCQYGSRKGVMLLIDTQTEEEYSVDLDETHRPIAKSLINVNIFEYA